MPLSALSIMGVVTFANFILIYIKFKCKRIADATLDLCIFGAICIIFSYAGQAGLFVGMIASFLVSIFLWFSPPTKGGVRA